MKYIVKDDHNPFSPDIYNDISEMPELIAEVFHLMIDMNAGEFEGFEKVYIIEGFEPREIIG